MKAKSIGFRIKTNPVSLELMVHPEYTFFKEYIKHYHLAQKQGARNERMMAFLFLHLTIESLVSITPYNVFSHISGPSGNYYKNLWERLTEILKIQEKLIIFFDLVDLTNSIGVKDINKWKGFLGSLSGIRNGIVHGHLIYSRDTSEGITKESKLYKILENRKYLDEESKGFYKFLGFYLDSVQKINFRKIAAGVNINREKFIQDIESVKKRFQQYEV